jgi:hypothetical protein
MKHQFDAQCKFLCPCNSYKNNCIKSGKYAVIAGKGNDFSTAHRAAVVPCILLCGGYQGPSPVVEQPGYEADQPSPSNDITSIPPYVFMARSLILRRASFALPDMC